MTFCNLSRFTYNLPKEKSKLKTFFLMLTMLVCSAAASAQQAFIAQPEYTAFVSLENPGYGHQVQIFNHDSVTHQLLAVDVTVEATTVCDPTCHPYTAADDGLLEIGFALSNGEQTGCQTVPGILYGGSANTPANPLVRVSSQPCNTVLGDTTLNHAGVQQCWGTHCTLMLPQGYTMQPNTGVSVWFLRYKNNQGFSVNGYLGAQFVWQ